MALFATGGFDHTLRFWNLTNFACTGVLKMPDSQINALSISDDKRFLAVAQNPCIKLLKLPKITSAPLEEDADFVQAIESRTLEGHVGNVSCVAFSITTPRLFSGGEDGSLRVWSLSEERSCLKVLEPDVPSSHVGGARKRDSVNCLFINPGDDSEVVVGHESGLVVGWLVGSRAERKLWELQDYDEAIRSVCVGSHDPIIVVATSKGFVSVYRPPRHHARASDSNSSSIGSRIPVALDFVFEEDEQPTTKIKCHDGYILKAALSPGDDLLATCSADKSCKLWDVSTMTLVRTLSGHQRWVWGCAWAGHPNDALVLSSSDHTSTLWYVKTEDPNTGKPRLVRETDGYDKAGTFAGHTKAVVACALNDWEVDDDDDSSEGGEE